MNAHPGKLTGQEISKSHHLGSFTKTLCLSVAWFPGTRWGGGIWHDHIVSQAWESTPLGAFTELFPALPRKKLELSLSI